MTTFAQRLRHSITQDRELNRLTRFFQEYPDASCGTSLSYSEARELGFEVYSSQRDGVIVSLPRNNYSQFGDH